MNWSNYFCSDRPRLHCLLPLSFILVSGLALANGTPIARSDVGATGNIRMVRQQNIDLHQETLQIVIEGDWALVRAEYHLVNQGPADTVAYGFPVDYDNPDWCNDCDDVSEAEKRKAGKLLRDVRIEANGKDLATREAAEPKPKADTPPPQFLRTWILTDLAFGEGERSVVTVSYRVRNWLNDWGWSTSSLPQYSKRKFRYLLSPSGNWGDGTVERLDISVDLGKLTKFGGKVSKVAPAGYTQQNDLLRWQFTDVDLNQLADINIEYDDSVRLLSELVVAERLPASVITRAQASSTLHKTAGPSGHDIAKLLDGDLDTTWCEGASDDGAGQTLTFDFGPGTGVADVGIVNGFVKDRRRYLGNGRVRQLTAAAEQQNRQFTQESSVSLPMHEFEQLNRHALASFIDWLPEFGDGYVETRRITLIIDAVTPGEKHSDTCISEIYFIGHSTK